MKKGRIGSFKHNSQLMSVGILGVLQSDRGDFASIIERHLEMVTAIDSIDDPGYLPGKSSYRVKKSKKSHFRDEMDLNPKEHQSSTLSSVPKEFLPHFNEDDPFVV